MASPKVLIYTATRGFRHDSIPVAIQALKNAGPNAGIEFDSTEDSSMFSDDVLTQYDAIMFLSTTGEVLDEREKKSLQNYLNAGGNFVGIHSASDCLVNTSFYGLEIGAFFDYHPDLQNAASFFLIFLHFTQRPSMQVVNVLDRTHLSTKMLPERWAVRDEMYNFKSDPRAIGAKVILSADESTYIDNGTRKFDQGSPHPTAWYQEHGAGVDQNAAGVAGRSFYTSLGHLIETWQDNLFLQHVMGGVQWVLQANTTKALNATSSVGSTGSVSSPSDGPHDPSPSNNEVHVRTWSTACITIVASIVFLLESYTIF